MKRQKSILCGVIAGVAFSLVAADIHTVGYQADGTTAGAKFVGFLDAVCWSDGNPAAPENNYWLFDYYFASIGGTNRDEDFAGGTLNLGAPSTSEWGLKHGELLCRTIAPKTVTVKNLVWWSGGIYPRWGGASVFKGKWTIWQKDAGAYHYTGHANNDAYNQTNMVTMVSAADDPNAANAVFAFNKGQGEGGFPNKATLATMETGTKFTHHFRGDYAGYKGSYDVMAPFQPFVLWNATVIGDPNTPKTGAIRLANNACIAFAADFAQDTRRGIEIYGTQAYFMTWSSFAKNYTVRYPVSGAGSFVKHGPGKVTLDCAYTAGAIVVSQGTLEIARTANVKAGTAITVKSGATLIVRGTDCWREGITVEQGGTVQRYPVATYDSATGKVTGQVTIPSGATVALGARIDFALSSPISVPFHETKRLAVATLGEGSTLTAADFNDATVKTCGLPKTDFEIEGGVLYLVARPVVTSVQAFADYDHVSLNGHDIDVNTNYWSNNARATSGYDYLLRNNVNRMGSEGFLGDSLTISNSTISTRADTSRISAAGKSTTVYPPVVLQPNHGSWRTHKVVGDIVLKSTYDTSSDVLSLRLKGILGNAGKLAEALDLRANVTGDGTILVIGDSNTVDTTTYHMGLHGDNSGYLGRIYLASSKGVASMRRQTTRLCFSEARNLGGEPDRFRYDALKVGNYAMLNPDATMTFDTANRGIHMIAGGFEVPAGVTFTSKVRLRQEGQMYKLGAGTLKLDGTICYKADGKTASAAPAQTTFVEEGAIAAGSDDGVKNMYLSFSDGAAIQVSPDDRLVNGFTGTVLIPSGKVKIVLDPAVVRGRTGFTVPIFTLASTAADLSDALTIVRVNGYKGELVKEDVTVDGKACVRYSVAYEPQGVVLILK